MSTDGNRNRKRKAEDDIEDERSSKRKKRVPLSVVPEYFRDPAYIFDTRNLGGGRRSTAILGPNSLRDMGSDADSHRPPAILSARNKYPECNFKAGHLLNADFGGDGTDSRNLTILSARGNSNHKGFDNPVKNALQALLRLYKHLSDSYVNIRDLRYGIEVSIEVSSDKWGDQAPDYFICNYLECSAEVWGNFDPDTLVDVEGNDLDERKKAEARRIQGQMLTALRRAKKRIPNPKT